MIYTSHYLDDFLVLGPPSSDKRSEVLYNSLQLCNRVGFPITPYKEGLLLHLSFPVILIDTEQQTLSLLPDKQVCLMILEWQGRKFCRKRELMSLIDKLQHANHGVRAGHTFLRCMINLAAS